MKLILASVRRRRDPLLEPAVQAYLDRIAAYAPVETAALRDEAGLFKFAARQNARTPAGLALLDSRGQSYSSAELARWLAAKRDSGRQTMIFAAGPPDGWSEDARKKAQTLLSLGPMTLAHELARLVLAEQIYRAFTILAGHPYHGAH